ncbi:E3 ubiquitin ligase TRIM40 [Sciurus carolinensis]|uniref:E3 ubiquitin ligase TRIM40 n=1 Tax=Sciurus carolinensis TaxID=30640 RepID=UPI001FB4D665|nr:E3 ubiquitin ligase TRIM40 [Sciurus carolinensis]
MVSLQEDSQEEDVCPICQEHPKEAVRTDCKHLFCQVCLAQHIDKALASEALCCPLCRKPYSEGVLGDPYICHKHQKRFQRFCEKSKCLLCVECLESPEHQSHSEPTIENAISHYKERLNRRCRRLRKDIGELQRLKAQEEEKLQALQVNCGNHKLEAELVSQHQDKGHLDVLPQQHLDQLEDTSAEEARILDLSKAITQISLLVADLESTAKELDANTLVNASDLLERHEPSSLSPHMGRPMT